MRWTVALLTLTAFAAPQRAQATDCESCLVELCHEGADERVVQWAEVLALPEGGSLTTLRVVRYEGKSRFNLSALLGDPGEEFTTVETVPGTQVGDTWLYPHSLLDFGDHLDVLQFPPLLVQGDALNCGAPVKQAVEVALDANCAESMDRQVRACTAQAPDETGCSTANGLGAGAVLLSLWMLASTRRTRSRRCERSRV